MISATKVDKKKKTVSKPKAAKAKPVKPAKEAKADKYFYATGRRKTAVARVRLYKGKGGIVVNDKNYKEYFPTFNLQFLIRQPLVLVGKTDNFDASIKVDGGGVKGQAEAVRHGIARALEKSDESLRVPLKKAGFLRRDPRMKERKKYGLKGARRAPQWQKR
jgi:small subunit ribosomal protein S9